jgi:isochorismate pyruvate lyase
MHFYFGIWVLFLDLGYSRYSAIIGDNKPTKYISKGSYMDIKTCNSLEETRTQIDKLDDQIVELIAARNSYVKQLAHFKNSVEEIKAEDRIADVINRVRAKAIEFDLSPNLINELFIRMIDDMVDSEVSEFKNAKNF